jgi:hypothetical protein
MNGKQIRLISILFIITVGCVVPGLSTPNPIPPAPTPTVDVRLPTMVAETFVAAMTQTMQALPPTPTFTFTPEPPAPTATLTATPPVGSSLTALENAATFFLDERGGYSITIPADWLVVRVNQPEYFSALSMYELSNPPVYESLKKIQNEDPQALRLFAVNIQDAAPQGEPATTITLILDETRGISFNSDQDMQAIAGELMRSTSGLEVTALDILITPNGMQFGAIESSTPTLGAMVYEKRVYFMGKTGMVYARLTIGESLKNDIIPAFDAIMDTTRLTE